MAHERVVCLPCAIGECVVGVLVLGAVGTDPFLLFTIQPQGNLEMVNDQRIETLLRSLTTPIILATCPYGVKPLGNTPSFGVGNLGT